MKKLAIVLLCTIPMLTACSKEPTNPAALEAAAKANGFTVEKIKDADNAYQFRKDECVVEFGFFNAPADAEMKFHSIANPIMDGRSGGISSSANMSNYHYASKLSGGKFFYATQVENTLFVSDNAESCEAAIRKFAEDIKY
ncbi:MAG: hypothetical protein IJM59_10165 [Proteobacteria bacterium]|nr:hypothetical protein [Pseudomonadota bacterium]